METSLEYILTNSLKAEMLSYLASHPNDFEELVKLAIRDKQPYSWRAAWLLSNSVTENDERIEHYVPEMICRLTETHDSQKRDLVNVLHKIEISEEYQGSVFNICIDTWTKLNKIPSVRWSALRLAMKITEKHPTLYDEIVLVTDERYLEPLSKGIKNIVRKNLRVLSERLKSQ